MRPRGAHAAILAALVAPLGLAADACLPGLDPARLLPECAGGAANGHLDEGEECDDGNEDDDDGCSARCRMECPAGAIWRRASGGNDHCYTPLANVASVGDARDRCSVASAFLVTVRTDAEREFLRSAVLSGQPEGAAFHTAYLLDEVSVTAGCVAGAGGKTTTCAMREAIADPPSLLREPGILGGYPSRPGNTCPGCYTDGLASGFWTQAKDRIVLDASGSLRVASAADPVAGAICERPPAGDPASCDGPTCAEGANTERRWNGYRYAYFSGVDTADGARTTCEARGGHLWFVESEDERESVFRFFRNELTGASAWLGLTSDATGAWTWSDGVAEGERPAPWALAPGTCASCCSLLVLGPGTTGTWTYAEGLALRTASCSDASATPTKLPFLCKIKAP